MLTIAVDAMGGDAAPRVVIEGVSQALDELPGIGKLLLVGRRDEVEQELARVGKAGHPKTEIVHADEVVHMHEPASVALRGKRNSSVSVATQLVKEGKAQALVSAGHTGAAVASTVVKLRCLPGLERPGIATVFPTPKGPFVLLDAGANVDTKPLHLVHYAIMGNVYAREILGIRNPRIGLLSVGSEEAKGNELTKMAFKLLNGLEGSMTFVGNVEGRDLFENHVDVVVCDGFVGNVVLKCCESLAKAMHVALEKQLRATPLRMMGAAMCTGAFRQIKRTHDYAEYGGAPLLGVDGVVIIGHGSSSAIAIRNAVRVAVEFVEHKVNAHIVEQIGTLALSEPDKGNA